MQVFITIIPIFIIVLLGWIIQKKGFMPIAYLEPSNRLVFYIAIPAMVYRSITKSSIVFSFTGKVIPLTLIAILSGYIVSFFIASSTIRPLRRKGSFVQSSSHGNLGYVGLAVVFYYMGDKGLAVASIVAGFMMILQNILSVLALQFFSEMQDHGVNMKVLSSRIFMNPVILSAIAGILTSALNIPVPLLLQKTLDILSGLALPTALLIIGASISLKLIRSLFFPVLGATFIKLFILPGIGFLLYRGFHLPPMDYLPGLILLSSPTATIAYVMGREIKGDPDFAAAVISSTTLLSALSFSLWLSFAA